MIVAIAAFVGMLLGIFNFFRGLSKDKVKLIVIPKAVMKRNRNSVTGVMGFFLSDQEFNETQELFAIEITNNSNFPITINEVGFKLKKKKNKLAIPIPELGDKGPWPRKLEHGDSVTTYGTIKSILNNTKMNDIDRAYAQTTAGKVYHGKSKALKLLINYVENNKKL